MHFGPLRVKLWLFAESCTLHPDVAYKAPGPAGVVTRDEERNVFQVVFCDA